MKRLIVLALAGAVSYQAQAQVDATICKGFKDAVEKNIKASENPKNSVKSSTWVKLAESYIDLGSQCPANDSLAAKKAYDAYQKALEVEQAAGGKKTKEITDAISEKRMTGTLLQQGAMFYNANSLKNAKMMFDLSSKLNQKDTTAALYAGVVNQRLQLNDEAKVNFQRFIDGGAKDPAIFYTYAQMLKGEKKYDDAVNVLKKGLERNAKNKDLEGEIINMYIASGNMDLAISNLSNLVKSDPKNMANLTNLGILYDNKAQDMNSKISDLKRELEKNNPAKLKEKLNTDMLTVGDFDNEIKKLTTAMKANPKLAASAKKSIADYTTRKAQKLESINNLKNEIAAKEASAGKGDNIGDQIAKLSAEQKDARAKAQDVYMQVLATEPNNYDANYNVAVMHFNDAVEIKKTIDVMDMKTYNAMGKEVEQKACVEFGKSKPFFDKCASINAKDEFVNETLKNLDKILANCNK